MSTSLMKTSALNVISATSQPHCRLLNHAGSQPFWTSDILKTLGCLSDQMEINILVTGAAVAQVISWSSRDRKVHS